LRDRHQALYSVLEAIETSAQRLVRPRAARCSPALAQDQLRATMLYARAGAIPAQRARRGARQHHPPPHLVPPETARPWPCPALPARGTTHGGARAYEAVATHTHRSAPPAARTATLTRTGVAAPPPSPPPSPGPGPPADSRIVPRPSHHHPPRTGSPFFAVLPAPHLPVPCAPAQSPAPAAPARPPPSQSRLAARAEPAKRPRATSTRGTDRSSPSPLRRRCALCSATCFPPPSRRQNHDLQRPPREGPVCSEAVRPSNETRKTKKKTKTP
jgi:hypothetical protein